MKKRPVLAFVPAILAVLSFLCFAMPFLSMTVWGQTVSASGFELLDTSGVPGSYIFGFLLAILNIFIAVGAIFARKLNIAVAPVSFFAFLFVIIGMGDSGADFAVGLIFFILLSIANIVCPFLALKATKKKAQPVAAPAFCKNCGSQIAPDAAFCNNCGTPRE